MKNNIFKIINEDQYKTKIREILIKLNNDILQLTNLVNDIQSKQKRLQDDTECIKSYINNETQKNKVRKFQINETLKEIDKSERNGWWFGY